MTLLFLLAGCDLAIFDIGETDCDAMAAVSVSVTVVDEDESGAIVQRELSFDLGCNQALRDEGDQLASSQWWDERKYEDLPGAKLAHGPRVIV